MGGKVKWGGGSSRGQDKARAMAYREVQEDGDWGGLRSVRAAPPRRGLPPAAAPSGALTPGAGGRLEPPLPPPALPSGLTGPFLAVFPSALARRWGFWSRLGPARGSPGLASPQRPPQPSPEAGRLARSARKVGATPRDT